MDFEDFYRGERIALLRLCYLVTLDADAAADAAQEAMLRAFTRWETLSGQRPAAWVRTVALNLCRSRWRRLQRDLRLAPRAFTVEAVPEVRDPDLLAALGDLPRRQREAVALRYWADLSVEECASMMGVSPGSVSQHLARARKALRTSPALLTLGGTS
jgi:RNA polymerase sigma-70 factor (ECF subfamily)